MCLHWESHCRPFTLRNNPQPTEPPRSGQSTSVFLRGIFLNFLSNFATSVNLNFDDNSCLLSVLFFSLHPRMFPLILERKGERELNIDRCEGKTLISFLKYMPCVCPDRESNWWLWCTGQHSNQLSQVVRAECFRVYHQHNEEGILILLTKD